VGKNEVPWGHITKSGEEPHPPNGPSLQGGGGCSGIEYKFGKEKLNTGKTGNGPPARIQTERRRRRKKSQAMIGKRLSGKEKNETHSRGTLN